jgi:hypothetical protein
VPRTAPEPPNPAEDLEWEGPSQRRPREAQRAPRDPTAVTQVLGDRPAWEGEVREPPGRSERRPPARGDRPPEGEEPPEPERLF